MRDYPYGTDVLTLPVTAPDVVQRHRFYKKHGDDYATMLCLYRARSASSGTLLKGYTMCERCEAVWAHNQASITPAPALVERDADYAATLDMAKAVQEQTAANVTKVCTWCGTMAEVQAWYDGEPFCSLSHSIEWDRHYGPG